MPSLESIIGKDLYKQLSEDIRKKYSDKADLQDVSDGAYIIKETYEQAKKEAKEYKKQVGERDTQITELKEEFKDAKGLKEKVETLEADNKKKDEDYQAELKKIKLDNAIEGALKSAKAKSTKALKAMLDLDKVKLDGDILLGINEQLESIKKEHDYMFEKEINGTGRFNTGGAEGEKKNETDESFATKVGKLKAERIKNEGINKFIK